MKYFIYLFFIFISKTALSVGINDSTCVNDEEKLYLHYFTNASDNNAPRQVLSNCNLTKEKISFKEAKFLYNTGKLEESKAQFLEIIKTAGGNELSTINYYLGRINYDQGNFEEALYYYESAEKSKNYKSRLHFNIAQCYYGLRLYEKSIRRYREIIETDNTRSAVWNNIGVNEGELGNYKRSLYCYLVSDSLANGSDPLYKSNIIDALRDLKLLEQALDYGNTAYGKFSDNSRVVDKYCLVLQDFNRHDEVKSISKKFLKEYGDDYLVYFRLGYSYDKEGAIDSAFHYYYKSLSLNPNQYALLHNMSLMYRIIGEFDLAKKYVKASLKVNPYYRSARHGEVNIRIWTHEYDEALKKARVFAEMFPEDPSIPGYLGYVLLLNKQYEKAIPWFLKDIEIDPNDSKPYNNLGRCYAQLKQFDTAEDYFGKALVYDSTNSYIYHNRASMYYELGNYQLACRDLSRAIEEEYNWVIDSSLYKLVENHCTEVNLNRKINFFGYKGNLDDMKDRSFIELIEKSDREYENQLKDKNFELRNYEQDLKSSDNEDNGLFIIYPNPTKGQVNLKFLMEVATIKVFDMKGTQLTAVGVENQSQAIIDLSSQPKGTYLIIASDRTDVLFTKQIIKN